MTKLQRKITKYKVMRLCKQLYQSNGKEGLQLISECIADTYQLIRLGRIK